MIHPLIVWLIIILLVNGLWIRNEQHKLLVRKRIPTRLYHEGESINLYVNKLTTTRKRLYYYPPIDYYRLVPYNLRARPLSSINNTTTTTSLINNDEYETKNNRLRRTKLENEKDLVSNVQIPGSIGRILNGDCIRKFPTINDIIIGKNQQCIELGSTFIDEKHYKTIWQSIITSSYHHNWFVDISGSTLDNTTQRSHDLDLLSTKKLVVSSTFPVGSIKVYSDGMRDLAINNHFNIVFKYKTVPTDSNAIRTSNNNYNNNTILPTTLYQITDLIIQPSSQINYYDSKNLDQIIPHCRMQPTNVIPSLFGISSSDSEVQQNDATELLIERGKSWKIQRPNGTVIFTYDIHWIPDSTSEKQYKKQFLHRQKKIRQRLIWSYILPILGIQLLLLGIFLCWWKQSLDHVSHDLLQNHHRHLPKWVSNKSLIRNTSRRIVQESIETGGRQQNKFSSSHPSSGYSAIVYNIICCRRSNHLEKSRILSVFCGFCIQYICASAIMLLVITLFGRSLVIDDELTTVFSLVVSNHITCAFVQGFITTKLDHTSKLIKIKKKSWDSVTQVSGPSMAVSCIFVLFAKVIELYTIMHFPFSSYSTVGYIIPNFHLLVFCALNLLLSHLGARMAIRIEVAPPTE